MTPRVSIVIPTYNRAASVRRAVDSIFAQTFSDFEVLVVDDGSSDDTAGVLGGYDGRLRYVAQENQGPAAARNHGMRLAHGEFIGFLDSDDLYFPNNIEAHLQQFKANPGAGLVYSGCEIVDADGNLVRVFRPDPIDRGDVLFRLLRYNFITTSTVLMRRECFAKVGGMNTTLSFAEDWYYWLRVAAFFPIDLVTEPLVRYQRSRVALSHGKPIEEIARRNMEMFRLLFADPDLARRLAPLKADAESRAYGNYAGMALERYQTGLARKLALASIRAKPTRLAPYALFAKSLLGSALLRRLRGWRRGG